MILIGIYVVMFVFILVDFICSIIGEILRKMFYYKKVNY